MPITLVASVPANATAYSASPFRSALTIGMTVVTASAWMAARKMSATAPSVTQTYCGPRCSQRRVPDAVVGHGATSAPTRSTASVSSSGRASEVEAHVARALLAEERAEVQGDLRLRAGCAAGLSPQPRPTGRPTRGSRHPGCDSAPGEVLGEQVREQPPVLVEGAQQAVEPRVALRENAATAASAPNRPVRHSTSRGGRARRVLVSSSAVTISAHLRPARLKALLALVDGVADARRRSVDASRNGVKACPAERAARGSRR